MGNVYQVVTNKGGEVVGEHKRQKDALKQLYEVNMAELKAGGK